MTFSDQSENLRIELDTHGCELREPALAKIQSSLDSLRSRVAKFPVSDLRVKVEFSPRSREYTVKTTLNLPNHTLVDTAHHAQPVPAYEQCVAALMSELSRYEARLEGDRDYHKEQAHTRQHVEPSVDPDADELWRAVEADDYSAFRQALFGYEESARKRAGRLIERRDALNSQVGRAFSMEEVTEAVFLRAFANHASRPLNGRLGEFIEAQIDPTLHALESDRDAELENVRMVRSAREAIEGADAVN